MNASLNTVVADISRKIKEQEEERIAQDAENFNLRDKLQVRWCRASCKRRLLGFYSNFSRDADSLRFLFNGAHRASTTCKEGGRRVGQSSVRCRRFGTTVVQCLHGVKPLCALTSLCVQTTLTLHLLPPPFPRPPTRPPAPVVCRQFFKRMKIKRRRPRTPCRLKRRR